MLQHLTAPDSSSSKVSTTLSYSLEWHNREYSFHLSELFFNISMHSSLVSPHRVSENDDNKMSPSNLGIVFGPTLLRPLVSTDMSLMALLETSYQAALVEFLIIHHDRIFGPQQISCTPPPPAPKAPLPDTPPRASCPLKGEVNSEHESSSRECPLSVEVSKLRSEPSGTWMITVLGLGWWMLLLLLLSDLWPASSPISTALLSPL